MKYLWILGLLALPAVGQIPNPVTYVIGTKVGALPAARSATYQFWGIYDGASSSDCTTGGGSSPVVCWSNGTTWSAVSGGSGTFTPLTGDATSTSTGGATTVVGINGVKISTLASGLLYVTTSTGVPSIATAAQVIAGLGATPAINASAMTNFPTFNQSTTGNAATATGLASYPALCTGSQFSQGLSSGSNNCANVSGSGGSITGFGTLVAYDVYYMPAGGSLATAKADGSINLVTNPAVCVASSTSVCATAGNTVTNGSWSWTVGGVLYVSDATTGLMTQTSPSTSGHYVQQIGIALSATVILIQPGVTQSL